MSKPSPDADPAINLSPAQLAVVAHGAGPLLVRGAGGTGKSTALRHRLVALSSGDVDPSRIALVTGTRDAAAATLSGLEDLIEPPYEELAVFTWPGLAHMVLRSDPVAAGIDPDFEILGQAERLAMLLVRFDDLPLRHHQIRGNPTGLMTTLIREVDDLKSRGVTAEQVWAQAGSGEGRDLRRAEIGDLIEAHDAILSDIGCLDENGAISMAARLIADDRELLDGFVSRHPHLLVDQAEELSEVAAGLAETLTWAVQSAALSIDETRAAPDSPAARLVDRLGQSIETVELENSWRLGPDAIDASRALLAGTDRAPSIQWRPADDGASIRFWRSSTDQAEAQAVAREIEHDGADGLDPEAVAIVVTDPNRHGPVIAGALQERGIPARMGGSSALFRQPEVRDTIAWLRALSDPTDASAVTRALTRPPIGLRSVDLAKLTVIARRRKMDMVSACDAATESPQIAPEARQRIEAFLDLYRAAANALDSRRPDVFVRRLIERVGFRRQRLFAAKPETAERLLGLSRLGEIASAWSRRHPRGSTREFTAYLTALSEVGVEVTDGSSQKAPGAVAVITAADLKGLPWQRVYVMGSTWSEPLDREALLVAVTAGKGSAVLSRVDPDNRKVVRPVELFDEILALVGGIEEVHTEELFGPAEDLHATYRMMRDEVLESSWKIGQELNEPRLDTAIDVNRAITRYLELLKLAALAQRPGSDIEAEAIQAVNGLLAQVATPDQLAELEKSTLDPYLLNNERERGRRQGLIDSRSEPSLAAFLPRRGEDLRLSASDLDLYLTCPLKYKFARVFGIPQTPTINQRFGILIHNVLQRFHSPDQNNPPGDGLQQLMSLFEQGWRRSGFGESNDELQYRDRAVVAMSNYWERESQSASEPVWLERQFEFKMGPHYLRGRVDRVDRRDDGGYEVIDYKTGQKVNSERLGGDIQLALYRLGAREAWNIEVDSGSYYYVLDGEKVEVESGPDDRERVERTVLEVGEGVLGQDFEPRPSPAVCSWCDYRLVCPAAEA